MARTAGETSIGGDCKEFPQTTAELLLSREDLCRRYWKPICHFLRVAWGKPLEDAKDLTQSFFLWLVEGDVLARFQPDRGSFRSFLKGCLRNFVRQQHTSLGRLKRGGGLHRVPLQEVSDPGRAFDEEWRAGLMADAMERVRGRQAGRRFRVFEEYTFPDGDRPTYAELGARHGVKATDIMNDLAAVREEIRSEVRSTLAGMVSGPQELEEEWHAFFRA